MHHSPNAAAPETSFSASDDDDMEIAQRTELLFRLDDEMFSIPVSAVNEIIDPQRVSPVPNADPLVPGIINVRGAIIPLFDIRAKLTMAQVEQSPSARMIVFEKTDVEGHVTQLAFCADAVEQVVERSTDHLDPIPELGVSWPSDCLAGTYHNEGELVICLDPIRVFSLGSAVSGDITDEAPK